MPSFFDLQRYAATGIASPDMTAYDKMRALAAFGGGAVQTLTGIPPLTFKADGSPLISWSMLGNGSQTGTPSPQSIIMPTFCGVRTGNLVDVFATDTTNGYVENAFLMQDGSLYTPSFGIVSEYFPIKAGETYTYSIDREYSGDAQAVCFYTRTKQYISGEAFQQRTVFTVVAPSNAAYIRVTFPRKRADPELYKTTTMLNSGSTALPYEPYGWKVPITCAGQTVPVYLGQTQTVRRVRKLVFNGSEQWKFGSYPYIDNFLLYGQNFLRQKINICVCTHLQTSANVQSGDSIVPDTCCFNVDNSDGVFYYKDTSVSSLSDFKSWLQQQYANGTPVTIWYVLATPTTGIVNEPLAKIGDYADELSSEDAAVTIPTVKGQNTLTVDTDLQPSEMTIRYRE